MASVLQAGSTRVDVIFAPPWPRTVVEIGMVFDQFLEIDRVDQGISVLFRGRGMERCLAEGRERFELWIGAAMLANNLMRIAAMLMTRSSLKRKAAWIDTSPPG